MSAWADLHHRAPLVAAERARGQEDPLEAPAETAEPLELAQSEDRKTGGWTEREGGREGAGHMEEL